MDNYVQWRERIRAIPDPSERHRQIRAWLLASGGGGPPVPEPELAFCAEDFRPRRARAHLSGMLLGDDHHRGVLTVSPAYVLFRLTGISEGRANLLLMGDADPDAGEYLAVGLALGVMDWESPWRLGQFGYSEAPSILARVHESYLGTTAPPPTTTWDSGVDALRPTRPLDEAAPDRELALAVIESALEDLRSPRAHLRADAAEWLQAVEPDPEEPAPNTLEWWCVNLGIEPAWVRRLGARTATLPPLVKAHGGGQPERDLTGQRFGLWTALRRGPRTRDDKPTWICRCDCGTERPVRLGGLRKSQSCGCASPRTGKARAASVEARQRRASAIRPPVGARFGCWTVRAHLPLGGLTQVECVCDCGTVRPVQTNALRRGISRSCGCQRSAHRTQARRERAERDRPRYRLVAHWPPFPPRLCEFPRGCGRQADYVIESTRLAGNEQRPGVRRWLQRCAAHALATVLSRAGAGELA